MKDFPADIAGRFLFAMIVLSYVLATLNFFAGTSIRAVFPVATLLSAMYIFFTKGEFYDKCKAVAVSLLFVAASMALCAIMEDPSFDGNTYHQEEIALMLDGWNPVRDTPPAGTSLWAVHYAKGIEIIAASVAAFTGSIESGKSVNIILIAASFLLTYTFFRKNECMFSDRRCCVLSLAIIANPVGICQSLTFYVDYTKYYLLLLTFIAVASLCRRFSSKYCLLLSGSIILASAAKFNIFFEEGIAMAAMLLWLLIKRNFNTAVKIACVSLGAAIIGLFLAFHPYVTNYMSAGHPLYPLLGEGAVDIMTSNTPAVYAGHGRIVNFFISYFTPAWPTISGSVNGFGVMLIPLLLLSVYVFAKFRHKIKAWEWYAITGILLSCFFYEQSWWARYNCQLWFIPCFAFYIVLSREATKLLANSLGLLFGVNIVLCAASIFFSSARLTAVRNCIYSTGRERTLIVDTMTPAALRHFKEKNIEVRIAAHVQEGIMYYYAPGNPYFPIVAVTTSEREEFLNSMPARLLGIGSYCVSE